MGSHGPLRDACCPSRVLQDSQVVRRNFDRGALVRGVARDQILEPVVTWLNLHAVAILLLAEEGEENLRDWGEVLLDVGYDNTLERGGIADCLHQRVKAAEDDDGLGPSIDELVLRLSR